jgi:two-component system, OmpR family, KDP operon response regulator KdpE
LMPIIVLSTSHDERSKVRAFDLGVDDYVTKPFADAELLARLRTALRHRFQARGEQPRFVSGDLTIDLVRRKVLVSSQPVALTRLEYKVLSVLARYAGRVVTHRQLAREVWGENMPGTLQPLRVLIGGLRRKIEPNPDRPMHIVTETRIGYRLILREAAADDRAADPAETVAMAGTGFGMADPTNRKDVASKQKDPSTQTRE